MGRASSIAKIIAKLAKSGITKVGTKVTTATGKMSRSLSRAAGSLGKLAKMGAVAGAGAAAANAGPGNEDLPSIEEYGRVAEGIAGGTTSDPTMDFSQIVPVLELPELPEPEPQPLEVDLKTSTPVAVKTTVDPVQIVENYFDDKYEKIHATEAVIPAGSNISAKSESLGMLQNTLDTSIVQAAELNARLKGVEEAIELGIDQNNQTKRENERRRDEEDIEKKAPVSGSASRAGEIGANIGAMTAGLLSKWVIPAIAVMGAGIASAFADSQEGNEETLGEQFAFLDDIEKKYVALFTAFGAAGGAITKGMKDISAALNTIKGNAKIQALGEAFAKAQTKVSQTRTGVIAFMANANKMMTANPAGLKFANMLNSMKAFFSGFAKQAKNIISPITKAIGALPKFFLKFFKGLLTKPLKYFIIFEAIDSMIDAAMAFAFNDISHEEFHTRCKKNINDILGLIGGTWITTIIFTAVGTAIGTVIPIFGNIAGAALGMTMGILFGEDVYKIIGGNVIVDAIYDYFVVGDDEAFKGLATKIMENGKEAIQSIIDRYAESVKNMVSYATGEDKIASVESIEEDYEDASLSDIAGAQLDKMGTDEDALLYVADNINSIEDLKKIDEELMATRGMTLNQLAIEELDGPDSSEYLQFVDVLNASIDAGEPEKDEKAEGVSKSYATSLETAQEGQYLTPEQMQELTDGTWEAEEAIHEGMSGVTETNVVPFNDSADVSDLDPQAVEHVRAIQNVMASDGEPFQRVSRLYNAALNVAKTNKYQETKDTYLQMTGRELLDDISALTDMEEAIAVDQIMSVRTPREMVEVMADKGTVAILEKYAPDVASTIREKANSIIPIITAVGGSTTEKENSSGSQMGSRVESAQPTFRTSDSFVTVSYQT